MQTRFNGSRYDQSVHSSDGPGRVTSNSEHSNSPRRDPNVGDVMDCIITLPVDTP